VLREWVDEVGEEDDEDGAERMIVFVFVLSRRAFGGDANWSTSAYETLRFGAPFGAEDEEEDDEDEDDEERTGDEDDDETEGRFSSFGMNGDGTSIRDRGTPSDFRTWLADEDEEHEDDEVWDEGCDTVKSSSVFSSSGAGRISTSSSTAVSSSLSTISPIKAPGWEAFMISQIPFATSIWGLIVVSPVYKSHQTTQNTRHCE
jgi:hypothetical protein